mgnify:CR=1 FL=1
MICVANHSQRYYIIHLTQQTKTMGLDQYAYARPPRKRNCDEDEHLEEWRKHNRLQGWMEQLWESKGCPVPATSYDEDEDEEDEDDYSDGGFNGIELQLDASDIEYLEEAILNQELPETSGFFFGSDSYTWNKEGDGEDKIQENYYYKEMDLQFVENAKQAIQKKYRVYYNCSW